MKKLALLATALAMISGSALAADMVVKAVKAPPPAPFDPWDVAFGSAIMTTPKPIDKTPLTQAELWSALLPWIIVCVVMLIWGNGAFKTWANSIFVWNYPVPELHNMASVSGAATSPTSLMT